MLGLSEAGIDKIRRQMGKPAESDGQPLRFFMPDWLRAWAKYTSGVLNEDGEADADDGGWLEEKRKWDAKRSQAAYLKERGKLVPLDAAKQIFTTVGSHIRRATESMCVECRDKQESALLDAGDDLARILNDDLASEATAEDAID